ncbi:hypothetical protein [Intrasporangium calvum]|uniref:hypothetical protein n=1 Tax=Intrasporangium calvum TaxID=53358 RepID=UPI0011D2C6FE|nr:hypothetical protein [Intrasporangium calvum]
MASGERPKPSQSPSPWEDGPTPVVTAGDAVLVRGDLRLIWRAALQALVVAAFFALLGATAGDDDTAFTWVVAGLFVIAAALRVLIWFRGLAARALISTEQYLVVMRRGRVERWMPWAAMTVIRVCPGDLLPEWHRGGGTWFTVTGEPVTAMRPISPFAGELGEYLVRRRDRAHATATIEAAADAHGVRLIVSQ